jgi:RNA polymerase sigma-70 factor (ECF subfamily)
MTAGGFVDGRSLFIRRLFGPEAVAEGGERVEAPDSRVAAPSEAAEEASLIARAQAGDQEAFGALVQRYQRQVYNLALRMLRDADEASEATQEAFLAAWQHLRGFRREARFATWLYRITYHHCLKASESRRRDSAVRAELSAASARMQSPEGRMSAHAAAIAEHELRETVRDEIAQLPPKYRAVLVLRHLQDLSYEEIADVMRVPIGTVKTQLFRARALLKERLEDLDRARSEGMARAGELRAELEAGLRTMWERHLDYAGKGDGP